MKIEIKKLKNGLDLPTPTYQSKGAAGFDLYAAIDVDYASVSPGHRIIIPTGVAVAVPEGYELQVRPRSGLAAKYGISIVNTPGTVDSDYRGELFVILINTDMSNGFQIKRGDRIAQGVVSPIVQVDLIEVDELSDTTRGTNGFGSTGI